MSQPPRHHPDRAGPDPVDGAGREQHPDEALAAYVDGSASPAEVATAREHLSTCASCREEVEIARGAVQALHRLPVLDPPWVAASAVSAASAEPDGVRPGGGRRVRSLDEHRSRRRGGVLAAVGLVAAASVAVVLILVNTGGGSDVGSATAPISAAGRAGVPAVTGADLGALTARLAQSGNVPGSSKHSASAVFGAAPSSSGQGQERLPAGPTIAPDAVSGVPCARRASGQSDSAVVVYAQVAAFQGKRVWVIGFVTTPASGGTSRVEVVAATTNGCTVVYVGRQALAATP